VELRLKNYGGRGPLTQSSLVSGGSFYITCHSAATLPRKPPRKMGIRSPSFLPLLSSRTTHPTTTEQRAKGDEKESTIAVILLRILHPWIDFGLHRGLREEGIHVSGEVKQARSAPLPPEASLTISWNTSPPPPVYVNQLPPKWNPRIANTKLA
jgi:hypothetical protein